MTFKGCGRKTVGPVAHGAPVPGLCAKKKASTLLAK